MTNNPSKENEPVAPATLATSPVMKTKRPVSEKLRKARIRRPNAFLEKAFPAAYVENGLNGTQAYLSVKPEVKEITASSEASKLLRKPSIREAISEAMITAGLTVEEAMKTHKRNMLQDKHFPTSQKAVEDVYQLAGMMDSEKNTSIQVGIIIEK